VFNTGATASFGGAISCQASVSIVSQGSDSTVTYYDQANPRAQMLWQFVTGNLLGYNVFGGGSFWMDQGSSFSVNGGAYKPGGGVWAELSDARIKTVQGDYAVGLDEVLGLRPVSFRYRGNDTPTADSNASHIEARSNVAPYPASPHYLSAKAAKTFIGLVAQEVEAVFPGMVTKRAGFIDGVAVADLRHVDTTPLIFALVNSCKELAARVAALETEIAALKAA
jgi:hypothetical protein